MRSLMICTAHQILFGLSNKRRVIWVGDLTRMGERRGPCRVSMGRPEGERPFERRRYRRELILNLTLKN